MHHTHPICSPWEEVRGKYSVLARVKAARPLLLAPTFPIVTVPLAVAPLAGAWPLAGALGGGASMGWACAAAEGAVLEVDAAFGS